MEIDRVIKIVDELNDLSDKFSDDELRVASYLLIRYGTATCKYYIDDSDLEKICKEIKDREKNGLDGLKMVKKQDLQVMV